MAIVSDMANGALGFTQKHIDRVIPPEHRQKAYKQTGDFASTRPILFAFMLIQSILAFIPLLLFVSFVASTFLLAVGTALIFTLFWIGVSLAVLIPTLVVTGSVGLFVWAWAVGSFLAVRWAYGLLQNVFPEMQHRNTQDGKQNGTQAKKIGTVELKQFPAKNLQDPGAQDGGEEL
ncbi:hypothetical protein QBC46DRAFT_25127 [Diplogelasinospora grovesii]|uniref:Uncharacterized protein n=1 Tax=Diplogelasinospora grovesii TaxID=303347 RepID=A0AAN6S0G2_9PEZI|nr:hypothetical protein QBC46DRAFT_25127 [Diplogelasinospora grovesii]